jgi:hypothetical protein
MRNISNFLKKSEIFASQGAPPVSTIPVGVNDFGNKFAASVNDTGGKLPPVSMTPVVNLPPVTFTLCDDTFISSTVIVPAELNNTCRYNNTNNNVV